MPLSDKGPYLNAALLCEKVLEEQDGVRSLIRVVDRVTNAAAGQDPPSEMPSFTISLMCVIFMKAGEARGRYAIKLRPEDPSGHKVGDAEVPVQFEPPGNRGITLQMPLNIQIDLEGVYWFDVLFVDQRAGTEELLTRLPLQILYQPQKTGGSAS